MNKQMVQGDAMVARIKELEAENEALKAHNDCMLALYSATIWEERDAAQDAFNDFKGDDLAEAIYQDAINQVEERDWASVTNRIKHDAIIDLKDWSFNSGRVHTDDALHGDYIKMTEADFNGFANLLTQAQD